MQTMLFANHLLVQLGGWSSLCVGGDSILGLTAPELGSAPSLSIQNTVLSEGSVTSLPASIHLILHIFGEIHIFLYSRTQQGFSSIFISYIKP